MKKLFMLLALVLGVVSCQNDPEGFGVVVGGEQDVNITVSLPDETRADSAKGFDLSTLSSSGYELRYILEIYLDGGDDNKKFREVKYSDATTVSFPVRLAPSRKYHFAVWADLVEKDPNRAEGANADNYYVTSNGLKNITIDVTKWTPNVEARDAFYGKATLNMEQSIADLPTIELTRPFAKVRVVATDIVDVRKFGIEPDNATVSYAAGMYESFNAVTGEAGAETTTAKAINYNIVKTAYTDATNQLTVFTDYILVPTSGTVQFSLDVKQGANTIKNNIFNTAIPVEKNKVTSIVGSVLTEGGNVNITVDSGLGEKETFTYISSGAELLKVIKDQNAGKYILGCHIDVDENDVALAGALSATRSTTTETVINLNGYTITINNKSNESLVTIADGYTLVFAGEGAIVMDADSTAPFVENNNTNGGVIIEQATLTNNSTNATIVEGTAVVNEGVEIEGNVATATTSQLDYVLANGGEVTLLANVNTDNTLTVATTNPVVINGNSKTITYTGADRAFTVENTDAVKTANVTLNDLTFVNTASYCQRGINFNVAGKLTLNNVTVGETGTPATYAINLPGYSDGAEVVIKNSNICGNIALNVWGSNMAVTATNTEFVSADYNKVENYAAISVNNDGAGNNAEGTNVNITGGRIVALDEDGNNSYAVRNSTMTGVVTISESTEVIGTISNPVVAVIYEGYNEFYTFLTLQDAIDKVCEHNSGFVRLIKDIELSETVTIPTEETVVIDLNGKTITGTDRNTAGNFYLIDNRGTLTISDSSEAKTGAIKLSAETERYWNASSVAVANNPGGKLVIDGGLIEHRGGTSMAYGVDNLTNGKGTYAETVINGGTIKSTYRAVRMFLNGIEAQNLLTVNGGIIEGANKSIWMQDPSTNANTGKLVVNEGATLNGDVYLTVTEGSTKWPVEVSIAASAVNGEVLTGSYVPAGYKLVKENGVWTVIVRTEVSSVEELEAALQNNVGGEVKLTNDITLSEPVVIESGKTVVLNLNGKTLTATGYAIENNGTLTITGDGTIYGIVYGENGTTTVENGTFNPADGGTYVFLNSQGGTLTINGGTINGGSSYPVYSYNENNKLIINDVTINGTFGCVNAYGTNGSVEINGGTFQMTGVKDTTSHITYFSSNIVATINGGTFEKIGNISMSAAGGGGICANGGAKLTINGGTFAGDHDDVYNYGGTISVMGGEYKFKPDFVADGYKVVENNGKYYVVAK